MRTILARTLQYSCTTLLLAQVAAPAAAQPRIPFPSVQPVTAQAEALMGSLSSAMDPTLALGDLSNHAASSISAALQDDIARLEVLLRDLRTQRRIIHEKLETPPPPDINQRKKLERRLQQVEAEIARCERQLAALLEEQERGKRRQSPAQQGPLSGGRFAFSNPAEQGQRMPGTYTARNGRIFAAALLQLPGNAWAALVRTSGPSAADMIARNDVRAAGALGLKIKGAGGGYRVLVWGGSSGPQAAVINPQAAVAGAPIFESPRFSERGAVRFLGLAQQSNDSLGAGIIPAAALVAVARQPASFAGGGERPGPEPERAPPPAEGGRPPGPDPERAPPLERDRREQGAAPVVSPSVSSSPTPSVEICLPIALQALAIRDQCLANARSCIEMLCSFDSLGCQISGSPSQLHSTATAVCGLLPTLAPIITDLTQLPGITFPSSSSQVLSPATCADPNEMSCALCAGIADAANNICAIQGMAIVFSMRDLWRRFQDAGCAGCDLDFPFSEGRGINIYSPCELNPSPRPTILGCTVTPMPIETEEPSPSPRAPPPMPTPTAAPTESAAGP